MGLSVVPGLPKTYSTPWAMRLSMKTCLPRMGRLLSCPTILHGPRDGGKAAVSYILSARWLDGARRSRWC
jgi:hypothetical protein